MGIELKEWISRLWERRENMIFFSGNLVQEKIAISGNEIHNKSFSFYNFISLWEQGEITLNK